MIDAPWRDGHTGKASAAQMRAGLRWAARYRRYPARTDQERLDDFERTEQQNERNRR